MLIILQNGEFARKILEKMHRAIMKTDAKISHQKRILFGMALQMFLYGAWVEDKITVERKREE